MIEDLLKAARAGNRRAIGRLLSVVERGGPEADALTEATFATTNLPHVIGITGPPGSGKSTLVGKLVDALAEAGHSPAVLAVDPSSPLSGGAILGDRIRIDTGTANAFIRSMATRGHSGGLALAVPGALRVFDAAGFDPVIVETVGVGQVEVDVTATADTTIVVANPGTGDAVQANKAGLLEVADIFVVNKADRPGADDVRRDLELMLDLSHMTGQEDIIGRRPPIVMVNSLEGTGVSELIAELGRHKDHLDVGNRRSTARIRRMEAEVLTRVQASLEQRLEFLGHSPAGEGLRERMEQGSVSPMDSAAQWLKLLKEDLDR